MNQLKELEALGQSLWLDYMKRSLIDEGELRTLIERDGLTGVTSNPSIFEKAIGETDEYADALKQFQAQADHSISAIYEHLAIADIRAAADVLRPVHEQTQSRDGYISLECSPYLANDTEATVAEALRLSRDVMPEVVVSDIAMPDQDGYTLLRALRTEFGPSVPRIAIALTAQATDADRERALAGGFDRHVAKPFDPLRLVELLRDVLAGGY